jgi:hypothetical protein
LAEWKASEAIKAWALVQPEIGEIDLRPYLFVAKDRKDYFGAASVLGRLAAVAEKLLGPKIGVQAHEGELRQLALAEAGQVFDAVRGRILSGDSFETEPAGVAGIAVLVRAHPSLQPNLLDLLEALPTDRLGAWVVSGWDSAIRDPDAIARFNRLVDGWANSGPQVLKVAASASARTRSGRR